ncbi:nuclear transcription factor Y subunit A-9 isoform X2 [Manihot esculenta]|uniref:nuclear transcription factor Y subunit A-9 isoform X2 n=1 Tax=Manihot esculenta TaxID=3983 RepID=UPI000B5D4683|nr:nuclear transcription factor Y subunit A-9 isoform X2 [Manihot esculenta]
MQMKLDNTSHPQLDPTNCMASSKAWWHGVRSNVVLSDMLEESTKNLLTSNYMDDGCGGKSGKSRAANHQFGEGTDAYKEMQFTALPQSDGKYGEEHQQQHLQHSVSFMPPPMVEYLVPPTQLEHVGPSLVHSCYLGAYPTRMVLPLEMTEEPVYVNAKQYHGILRRRQSRAKAELEKKLIKVRKLG